MNKAFVLLFLSLVAEALEELFVENETIHQLIKLNFKLL